MAKPSGGDDAQNHRTLVDSNASISALAWDLDVGTSLRTPRLDALAAQGANFSNAYCNAPICVPSRMSFLSARQASEVGGFENDDRLSPLHAIFVHGLAAWGYRTVLCGKMHFLDPDYFHGYQENVLGEPVQGLFAGVHFDTPHPCAMGVNPLVFSGPGSQAFQHYDRAVATNSAKTFASHPHRENQRAHHDPLSLIPPWRTWFLVWAAGG